MFPSSNYMRAMTYGSTIWSVTQELASLSTDDVLVGPDTEAVAPPPASLTERLTETPVLRLVAAAALDAVVEDLLVDGATVDDVVLRTGDAVLLLGQAPPATNGVCVVGGSGSVWVQEHALVAVLGGTVLGSTLFVAHRDAPGDALRWVQIASAGSSGGGGGLTTTLGSEPVVGADRTDAVSLVGPTSGPPRLRVRYLVAGEGVRLSTVDGGAGLAVGTVAPLVGSTHTGVGATDVVATTGLLVVDPDFPRPCPAGWPAPSVTVPALVFGAAAAGEAQDGSVILVVPDLPTGGGVMFDVDVVVLFEGPGPLQWAVTLSVPPASTWHGTLALAPAAAGACQRCRVTWDANQPDTVLATVLGAADPTVRPRLPPSGDDLVHLRLSSPAATSTDHGPVGILGLRFVWWPTTTTVPPA